MASNLQIFANDISHGLQSSRDTSHCETIEGLDLETDLETDCILDLATDLDIHYDR